MKPKAIIDALGLKPYARAGHAAVKDSKNLATQFPQHKAIIEALM